MLEFKILKDSIGITDHNIDVDPCNGETTWITSCSGGILTMTKKSGGRDNDPKSYTGVVSSTTLFIQVSEDLIELNNTAGKIHRNA